MDSPWCGEPDSGADAARAAVAACWFDGRGPIGRTACVFRSRVLSRWQAGAQFRAFSAKAALSEVGRRRPSPSCGGERPFSVRLARARGEPRRIPEAQALRVAPAAVAGGRRVAVLCSGDLSPACPGAPCGGRRGGSSRWAPVARKLAAPRRCVDSRRSSRVGELRAKSQLGAGFFGLRRCLTNAHVSPHATSLRVRCLRSVIDEKYQADDWLATDVDLAGLAADPLRMGDSTAHPGRARSPWWPARRGCPSLHEGR